MTMAPIFKIMLASQSMVFWSSPQILHILHTCSMKLHVRGV